MNDNEKQDAAAESGVNESPSARRRSANPRNEHLGYADHVNGEGGTPAEGFAPSGHELFLLACHYAEDCLDVEIACFVYEQYGSQWRERVYALERLARIEEVTGREVITRAWEAAKLAIRKQWGENDWACFVRGDRAGLKPVYPEDVEEAAAA